MRFLLIAVSLIASPAIAETRILHPYDMTGFSYEATTEALMEANYTCVSGEDHYGTPVEAGEIAAACLKAERLVAVLRDNGWCADEHRTSFHRCDAPPAQSSATKIWADDACALVVESVEGGFTVYRDSNPPQTAFCEIESWPISSPIAILACDDGSKPEMQLVAGGDTMAFEDMILRVPTDENGVCD